jgi:glycosyltransferase involved in cell wall biosynthesis
MPVYNNAAHITQAVDSILNQTFKDFELLVINDKSTDVTLIKLKKYTDPRIIIIENEQNIGRAGCDNIAIRLAKGEYIAKMDGDDICHPQRLELQLNILKRYSNINVVGSSMQNFGYSNYLNIYPESPELAKCQTLFTLPVGNPSVMMRSTLFSEKKMVYNESYRQSEDLDFFSRYINQLHIFNLRNPLIQYRTYQDSAKAGILSDREKTALKIQYDLLKQWGIPFSSEEFNIHSFISSKGRMELTDQNFKLINDWLHKLKTHNEVVPWFDNFSLNKTLASKWFDTCYNNCKRNNNALKIFKKYNGTLGETHELTPRVKLKFYIKNWLHA